MDPIVELIDRVIMNITDEALISKTKQEVNQMMAKWPMFREEW